MARRAESIVAAKRGINEGNMPIMLWFTRVAEDPWKRLALPSARINRRLSRDICTCVVQSLTDGS
jgi:hypothetical protein